MASLFCCEDIQPYRPQYLLSQTYFTTFMDWAAFPKTSSTPSSDGEGANNLDTAKPDFVIQLVRQVNYGPLESTRYFSRVNGQDEAFLEVVEKDLIDANFKKLNAYKNYRCDKHNKFFEINVYQKDPINKHHWRANLARPASSIDL